VALRHLRKAEEEGIVMAEPIQINSGDLVREIGLLYMETRQRAAREDALVVQNQQLQALVRQLQEKPKRAKKGG
jgi:hypothetical protein